MYLYADFGRDSSRFSAKDLPCFLLLSKINKSGHRLDIGKDFHCIYLPLRVWRSVWLKAVHLFFLH